MLEIARDVGAYAGLVAFAGLALLIFLQFTQGRDIRRLREWAGSAPERDAVAKEETSELAASRAQELREIEEARRVEQKAASQRDVRRDRREAGLPELTRWERIRAALPEPRYIVLIVVTVVILGAGVAYAATHFLGSEGSKHSRTGRTTSSLQPKNIKVSVLNGTAVSGLAGRYGDKLDRKGYTLDAVTNTPSSFAKSVVMFRRGRGPEAREVSRAVAIPKLRLMTKEIAASAASAEVAVVVGEDRASS